MALRVKHSPGLVADRELVLEDGGKPQALETPIQRTVPRIEDKMLDLGLKKLHNCDRCDIVES